MLVYYTFQDSKGRTFPDGSKMQTWMNNFPTSVTIGEMKEILAKWHSLDPSSLTIFSSFQSCKADEENEFTRFGSCVEYPLVVSVNDEKSRKIIPKIMSSKLPISRVLQYLVTREKKFKPIVVTI
jgi:hypothetical protein